MKRFLQTVAAAVVVGLVGAAVAEAAGKGGPSGGSGSKSGGSSGSFRSMSGTFKTNPGTHGSDYHMKYGTRFKDGWFYKGRDHFHWTSWCWNPSWGCYNYWCPSSRCWFYWYEPHACYYPISYISTCAPASFATPEQVPVTATPLINIQNSAANGGGVAANNTPGSPAPVPPPPGAPGPRP
jgi:hypothetical protein